MKSIAVTKPDMAVLRQDRTGLSSFGMLSALFGQEVLQRSQRRLGFWQPVALELLEEEQPQAAEKGGVNINLDMTVLLKALREEQKGLREQDKREKARTMEKLVERVVLRGRTERVEPYHSGDEAGRAPEGPGTGRRHHGGPVRGRMAAPVAAGASWFSGGIPKNGTGGERGQYCVARCAAPPPGADLGGSGAVRSGRPDRGAAAGWTGFEGAAAAGSEPVGGGGPGAADAGMEVPGRL